MSKRRPPRTTPRPPRDEARIRRMTADLRGLDAAHPSVGGRAALEDLAKEVRRLSVHVVQARVRAVARPKTTRVVVTLRQPRPKTTRVRVISRDRGPLIKAIPGTATPGASSAADTERGQ
jgi:hypothetical protein